MTYTLFLDDERHPVDPSCVVVRYYDHAVSYVTIHGTPTHVCFDHDLGDGKSGLDFAKWLVNNAMSGNGFPEAYSVHSQNPVGASNIRAVMNGYMAFIAQKAQPNTWSMKE